MAPSETASHFTTTSDPDPLAPKAVVTGKTRYSAKAKTIAAEKAAVKTTKAKEKALETPAPASAEEKASDAIQAAPLGLNGDTGKKKKPAKVKGAPKERMQDQPKAPPAPPQEPMPYKTPKPDASAAPAPAPTASDSSTTTK
jgi:peptidyl-prolyl cis-trans isomerase SurA